MPKMVPYVPVNYAVARFLFTCVGLDHLCGFSLGIHHGIDTPADVALYVSDAFVFDVLDDGAGMGIPWTYMGLVLTVSHDPDPPTVVEHPDSVVGTLSPSPSPPNCAMIIQKKTGIGGRRYRGRAFVPPVMLNDADVDAAGNLSAGLAASHTVLWENFRTSLENGNVGPVLVHQYEEGVTTGRVAPTDIIAFQAAGKIGTQRRRLR